MCFISFQRKGSRGEKTLPPFLVGICKQASQGLDKTQGNDKGPQALGNTG